MAVVHDVLARFSGGTVRSTLTIDDKPGTGTGVYRVGPVVDGQGVVTEAQQTPVHRPMFEAGGLAYVAWRGVCALLSFGWAMTNMSIMGTGWLSWNTLHLLVWRGRILLEQVEARMNDYAVERHPSLAPWVDRDGYVLKLPADVVDDTKQLESENAAVHLLPKTAKKKEKASA